MYVRTSGRTVYKILGILAAATGLVFTIACPGLVEEVKPVDPFKSNAVSATPAQAQKKYEWGNYRADRWRAVWGQQETATLKGNVKFTSGDTVLLSDQVEWDETAQTAVSPGKVNINNPQCDISGDKGTAFFKKRLGVIENNVVMLLKPKQAEDAKPGKENIRTKLSEPTTVSCKKLEYQYKKKVAVASGGVVFKQAKRSASSDSATYDQNKELLTLVGHVQGVDEKGQTFSAPGKVVISLKKGDEWIEAQDASASFKVEQSDEPQDATSKP